MAVNRVERLLRKVTKAMNDAGIEYAVIGGNAVAAWVATVDEGAVRATKDVDVLIRRGDLVRVTDALRRIGLVPIEVLGVHMFVDRRRPNPKTGVHVVFGGEKVRAEYKHPAPDPSQSVDADAGFRVLRLSALVAMKLQAWRLVDRVHLMDLNQAGLLETQVQESVPRDLRKRLRELGETE